jgi:hypothetical protein
MKNRLRATLGAIVLAGQLGADAQAQTTPSAGRLLASN